MERVNGEGVDVVVGVPMLTNTAGNVAVHNCDRARYSFTLDPALHC